MKKEYLLNRIINILLEHGYLVQYESSNPVTFSFEYSNYQFYLVWDIETMSNEDINLVYRLYLNHMSCSMHETLLYIDHISDKEEFIKIKLTEDYIAYVDSLNISAEHFTYEMLIVELKSFLNLLDHLEMHLNEVRQNMTETLEKYKKQLLEGL